MKLGALFSGGKDSTYAIFKAKQEGHEIACLISVFCSNDESYMFHTANIHLVGKQAELMGLDLVSVESKGEKELELRDLEAAVGKAVDEYGIEGIVCGAIGSKYQYERVSKVCEKLGLKLVSPLWQKDSYELLKEMISAGFEIIVVQVSGEGLGEEWLGKKLDAESVEKLNRLAGKFGFDVAGEGGDWESLVLNCPLFSRGLRIVGARKEMEGEFSGRLVVEKVE